nr:hypothetical protein [Actinomycetota bacterium]
AESWLSSSSAAGCRSRTTRPDSPVPATADDPAAPALTVLRESSARLSRLADADADAGLEDIVEELQIVERAVAALLGAVSLSAGAPPTTAAGLVPAPRTADDWTTTGASP